ncbi:hypothetical protein B0T18DRAFT_403105 [Schizothecium vesticola]|uniref:Secreted protein n=1 Tax=Schizothecium vesticola TaxID=314040 RepID=A0AA40F6D6_9PEZI|nr:hypothetical protein B0T18DRAFT_403105 [Schizothecium vesticola]
MASFHSSLVSTALFCMFLMDRSARRLLDASCLRVSACGEGSRLRYMSFLCRSGKAGRGVVVGDSQADTQDGVPIKIGQSCRVCVLECDGADLLRRLGVMVIVMKLEAASRIPADSIALDSDTVLRVERRTWRRGECRVR